MADQPACLACGKPLSPRKRKGCNPTGYCRAHCGLAVDRAAMGAKVSASRKRMFAEHPEKLAARRAQMAWMNALPQTRAAGLRTCIENRIWERGLPASQQPEVRARAALRASATKLAWCPPHLRDMYRTLRRTSHLSAAEVRAIVLDHHEAEMVRWRHTVSG